MSNFNKKLAQIKKDKNLTNQTQEGEMSLTEKLETTLNELKQVKNGRIVTVPQFDTVETKARIQALQTKQPWTVAKERARAEALAKKRK
jgi:hypothetical protein